MKYEIQGETLPVVICHLEANERMITENGAMSWMSPNMKMELPATVVLEKHLAVYSAVRRCFKTSIPLSVVLA